MATWARQAWEIARIELRRAFFSKRAFWVYLLALFPAVLFIGHGIAVKYRGGRMRARQVVQAALIEKVPDGASPSQVIALLGQPAEDDEYRVNRGSTEHTDSGGTVRRFEPVPIRRLTYYDGRRVVNFVFEKDILQNKRSFSLLNLEQDRQAFAAVFQYFYLRLAIFFGCLGIFMNLFRGEMLDKTLHFWFLVPVRREVLLAGKYTAGLLAATVIFTGAAAITFGAMLWPYDPVEVSAYWNASGLTDGLWYMAAAALGCVGYGSVFVAAGLLLRNPIIPAAVLLGWESINGFLPEFLQKFSVLYYLQSMCPTPAPIDSSAPALIRLLIAPAAPAPRGWAVLGLLALTALVLYAGARAVRRLEINYSTE
jgi:ABC-type transport system involved in multi-copper enzyme maturation permease subunit